MRTAFPIAITLALLSTSLPADARSHPDPLASPVRVIVGDQWDVLPLVASPAKHGRRHRAAVRHHHHRDGRAYAPRRLVKVRVHRGTSLAGFPAPLVAKVSELQRDCGATVISAFRPGARVAGSGRISNHALKKAVDLNGPPKCLYAHVRGWPGGVSTDYWRVRHLHLSYNRGKEWGVRFAHGGGHSRYAHRWRHRHYARG